MREIKFRAWDKVHKEMITWDKYKDELVVEDFIDNDLVLLQYTGLKDKNGVEIYEGDILEIYDREGERPISKAEVYWNNGYWDAKAIGNHSFWSCYSGFIKNKVIGNIYENPELLEVSE